MLDVECCSLMVVADVDVDFNVDSVLMFGTEYMLSRLVLSSSTHVVQTSIPC